MTRRTRLFVLVAAGVLVAGLGTGLLASYMGVGLQSLTILSPDGPAELAYVPQDAEFVAFANVREIMDSELRKKLQQLRPETPPATPHDPAHDFETQTGINIERDIDEVVVALGRDVEGPDNPLVVARGRFDQARIEGLVLGKGGRVEGYKEEQILLLPEDHRQLALSFVESDIVLVGPAADVRRAIDTKLGTIASLTARDEIMNLIRDASDGNAWAVGRFDSIAKWRLPDAVGAQLPPINWFAATGRINGGVEAVIRAEADTDHAATDLRQVISGFMALARLQTRQSAEIAAMLNSVKLGGDGRTVSLAFSVPSGVIDALAEMHRRHTGHPSAQAAR
jgi:hypothetical protein